MRPAIPLRLALIGCGQISRLHAQRIQTDGRSQLVALYDACPTAAEQFRREFENDVTSIAVVHPSLSDLFDRDDIDAVLICSPTHLHFDHVKACRLRGWPILCEKPLADTRDRIENLITDVQSGGPLLSLAYQRRTQAVYRTLRREIQSGQWGRILAVASHNCEHWEQRQAIPGTWRDDPAQNPGGYLGDAGSHKLDILFFITGLLPVEVFAFSDRSRRHVEIATMVSAKLTSGIPLGMTFLGHAHHFAESLHIVCEGADFHLQEQCLWYSRESTNTHELVSPLEPESNPISGFFDTILDGAENIAPVECARPVFQMTQAILESAQSGAPVKCD